MTESAIVAAASSSSATHAGRRHSSGHNLTAVLERYAFVIALFIVILFFSLWPETAGSFPTLTNLQTILGNQAVVAVVSLGTLMPLICGRIDLSVGATAGLASVVFASLLSHDVSVGLAFLGALAVGLTVGTTNAILVTILKVDAVIATLGVSTVIAGVVNQITSGLAISGYVPDWLFDLGSGLTLGIPNVGFVVALLALSLVYLLIWTPYGRYLYALGSNFKAAQLVGLQTNRLLGSTFVLAGAMAAIGGTLNVSRVGGADPRLGDGLLLQGLTAVFLSAAVITPGRYNIGGVLVSIIFLATLNSGLNLAGVPVYLNSYVNGISLIIGVSLAAYLGRRRAGGSIA